MTFELHRIATQSLGQTTGTGPDFIGIGVQKCGTSWIGDVLAQHPGVLFRRKEVNYFCRNFHRGEAWYHTWFEGRGERRAGEITPNYIITPRPDSSRREFYPRWHPRRSLQFWRRQPAARDEIFARYPNVRLFAIFRNPVERAWSHYWMWRNRKRRIGKSDRVVDFKRMFAADGRWIRTTGYYADHLAHWRERFPDLAVYLYDDLKEQPFELAARIYRDLDLDDRFVPEVQRKVNVGHYDEPMALAERQILVNVYRDQVLRFGDMVGRDLNHWLRLPAS